MYSIYIDKLQQNAPVTSSNVLMETVYTQLNAAITIENVLTDPMNSDAQVGEGV